jgi:imidazolonepropionase-like amidohydrolase
MLVVKAGTLIAGTDAPPVPGATVHIDRGVITAIAGPNDLPAGAEVLDWSGQTVLPGLIDCHVHLVFSAGANPLRDVLAEDDRALLLRAAQNARQALAAGITTVRDLGGRGGVTLTLRDAIAAGLVPGPRVLAAGAPLTITGGHCHFLGLEADTAEEVRKAARWQLKVGADCLKLMATGGRMTPGTNVRQPQYGVEELRAAVAEARRAEKTIAAHAIGTPGIRNAVAAGVDTIEHCSWVGPQAGLEFDERVAAEMPERGVYVDPTLIPVKIAASGDPALLTPAQRENVAIRTEVLGYHRRMLALGVQFIAGTDAGVARTPFDILPLELQLLVEEIGLTPVEAIHAATGRAAKAIGIGAQVGTIEPGRRADLLVVDGDPSADITVLQRPGVVLQAGRVVARGGRLV